MQATIHTVEPGTGTGTVIFDDGHVVPFERQALAGSGLLDIRVGQRLSLEQDEAGIITRLWIVGIGDSEVIR